MKNVTQYRAIQTRLSHLSEAATSGDGVEGSASILKIDIDGLDQAKTRWPRGISNSKSLSTCWRPQIHMVGVIVWGVARNDLVPDLFFSLHTFFFAISADDLLLQN